MEEDEGHKKIKKKILQFSSFKMKFCNNCELWNFCKKNKQKTKNKSVYGICAPSSLDNNFHGTTSLTLTC